MPPFVTIPRSYAEDYRERRITKPERQMLEWLRQLGNPYGIAVVDLESLAADCLSAGSKKNYANKLLLSLKRKRYIYYDERRGGRGSFQVHLDLWPLPRKRNERDSKVKRITAHAIVKRVVRTVGDCSTPAQSEADPELENKSQKLEQVKSEISARFKSRPASVPVRGSYTDTHKETYTNISRGFSREKFRPQSFEEEECVAIADSLGENTLENLIFLLQEHGINLLKKALTRSQQQVGFYDVKRRMAVFQESLRALLTEKS